MALPSGTYAPRDPAASVLYQVVRDHYHTFQAEASQLREGEGLPHFVDDEFDAFLKCGWLAGGFARFRCTGCRAERLVAFSCKGRGYAESWNMPSQGLENGQLSRTVRSLRRRAPQSLRIFVRRGVRRSAGRAAGTCPVAAGEASPTAVSRCAPSRPRGGTSPWSACSRDRATVRLCECLQSLAGW